MDVAHGLHTLKSSAVIITNEGAAQKTAELSMCQNSLRFPRHQRCEGHDIKVGAIGG